MKKAPELTVIESVANSASARRTADSRGTRLKQSIITEHQLDDMVSIELLEQISAAIDRLDAVTQLIAADGVMVKGQRGPRVHPLLKIESMLRCFIVRSLAKIGAVP